MCCKFIIANLLLIFVLPFALYADTCFVASGQTVAFTLSAGAKASWNNTITDTRQWPGISKASTSFSVYQLSNGNIVFKTQGFKNDILSKISLFSVSGRKIGTVEMNGLTAGEFNQKLVAGIYFARFEADGIILKTTRFMVGK